jgi:hypothetical protein
MVLKSTSWTFREVLLCFEIFLNDQFLLFDSIQRKTPARKAGRSVGFLNIQLFKKHAILLMIYFTFTPPTALLIPYVIQSV